MSGGQVHDIYERLKQLAVGYRLKPGDRINEVALSKEMGVSRTPLREALNRLVAENLFEFKPGQGFFCRTLDAQTVFDLYECRRITEAAAARLACERATDEELRILHHHLLARGVETAGLTVADACARDEAFHMNIARLAQNQVLASQLTRLNERIRYIRWISMADNRLQKSKGEHIALAEALVARDADRAEMIVTAHIAKRMDEVVEIVRHGIASIYMHHEDDPSERVIEKVLG